MNTSRERLEECRTQLDQPSAWWRFSPELELEFIRRTGQSFLPIARSAFWAVIALVLIVMLADQWLLEARLDAPVVAAMFGVEIPLMIGLYLFVGRLPGETLPKLMAGVMAFQGLMFTWVALQLAAAGDTVPYLYEILVLYQFFLFFFTGVMFVPAVVLGALCIALAVAGYVAIGIDSVGVARVALFLLATYGIGVVVRYLLERILRQDFLIRIVSEEASRTDPLTSLLNRRGFETGLSKLLGHARRYQCPVGLLMIDLDNFKQVNDSMGHAEGDALLVSVAGVLETIARRSLDLISRSGGDEFVVAVYDASEQSVKEIADKLESALAEASARWTQSVPALGASVGAVWFAPADTPADTSAMLEVLDRTLYDAKRAGKGQVKYERTGKWSNADELLGAPLDQAGV
ncbi:diguanylate cyclase [bacterium]|nr:diguanylate cyclase [bacterium]